MMFLNVSSFDLVTGQAYYYSRRSDFAMLPKCNYLLAGTLQMVVSYRKEFGELYSHLP